MSYIYHIAQSACEKDFFIIGITMKRIDLTGEWNLAKAGASENIKAAVPGDTHSALLAGG